MSSAYLPFKTATARTRPGLKQQPVLARLSAPPTRNGAIAGQSLAADGRQSSV